MTGAVDFKECPQYGSSCRCEPKCAVCGFGKHMAVHGPHYGEPPGSKPWGHEFKPAIHSASEAAVYHLDRAPGRKERERKS